MFYLCSKETKSLHALVAKSYIQTLFRQNGTMFYIKIIIQKCEQVFSLITN